MSREFQVTFDCHDPAALAAFWAEALGYRIESPPAGYGSWDAALEAMGVPPEHRNDASALAGSDGAGARIFFQRSPRASPPRIACTSTSARPPGRRVTSEWPLWNRNATGWWHSARRDSHDSSPHRRCKEGTS